MRHRLYNRQGTFSKMYMCALFYKKHTYINYMLSSYYAYVHFTYATHKIKASNFSDFFSEFSLQYHVVLFLTWRHFEKI